MDDVAGGAPTVAGRGPEVLVSTPARDRQLVRAAALGDGLAWDELVDAHGQLVWSVLHQSGLGRDEAVAAYELIWVRLAQCLAGQAPDDRGHYICYLGRKHLPARIRAFVDHMTEQIRRLDLQIPFA